MIWTYFTVYLRSWPFVFFDFLINPTINHVFLTSWFASNNPWKLTMPHNHVFLWNKAFTPLTLYDPNHDPHNCMTLIPSPLHCRKRRPPSPCLLIRVHLWLRWDDGYSDIDSDTSAITSSITKLTKPMSLNVARRSSVLSLVTTRVIKSVTMATASITDIVAVHMRNWLGIG